MHKVLILACCVVSISFASSNYVYNRKTLEFRRNNNTTVLRGSDKNVVSKPLNKPDDSEQLKEARDTASVNKQGTLLKSIVEKVVFKIRGKQDDAEQNKQVSGTIRGKSNTTENIEYKVSERKRYSEDKVQKTFPMLQKIHARITRSKDAIWATITLTALCILLVLAVAQSRMWKDHYYSESQGVPLPNFNERVLFKDVMEHKISSLKQFFKKQKRAKEKNITELESLLPPSEWDS